jgi:hypothetical protein
MDAIRSAIRKSMLEPKLCWIYQLQIDDSQSSDFEVEINVGQFCDH